jgi:prolipoprotein diacylglyceryl transferase
MIRTPESSSCTFDLNMILSLVVYWNPHPEIWPGVLPARWYGLLFMSGFVLGYQILKRYWKRESRRAEDLDDLALYVGVGTILGARLGHCLFYEPAHYLSHPIEILKVWQGGLASHGAAITIPLSLWWYVRRNPSYSFWWIIDRLVVVVALAGGLIRLGNLMNSEIFGKPTDLPWGFVFERLGENFPRHPSQLYEATFYFVTFVILHRWYQLGRFISKPGAMVGAFLVMVFGFRFGIEFIKANQVAFESGMALNMGQWLSLPAITLGLWLWIRQPALKKSPSNPENSPS